MAGIVTVAAVLLTAVTSAAPDEARPDFLSVQWHVVERREPIHFRIEGYAVSYTHLTLPTILLV